MEHLLIINPYNSEHRDLITKFEKDNSIDESLSGLLNHINTSKELQDERKESNIVDKDIAFIEKSEIKDICHINGEKDRKTCQISFLGKYSKKYIKRFIITVTEYAINNLGMLEVFINIDNMDKEIKNYLISQGYEDLGTENGKAIFLKEKEEINKELYYETSR